MIPTVAPLGGGGQQRGEDEDDNARAATDSQSATELNVQGSCVPANQQVWSCKEGPLPTVGVCCGPTQVIRAPSQSRRFPSFLVVSRRFSGVPPRIRIRCGLRGPEVLQDRPDPGRIA